MKSKITIILVGVVIAIVATAILVYVWRKNSVEQWDEVACDTFKEALNEDLNSRSDLTVESYGRKGLISVATTTPKSVFITNEHGRREYKIDSCRHVNNVTPDAQMRGACSIVLEESPLVPDTINAIWKRHLDEQNIVALTEIRISVTDLEEHTTSQSSEENEYMTLTDSLISCYAGYRCEVEVTGFIRYSWIGNIYIKDFFVFSIPLLVMIILLTIGYCFWDKIEKYLIKEVPVIVEKEVPVIIEKEIQVIATGKGLAHIYRLADGTLFDFDEALLKDGEHSTHLSIQEKTLLKAFVGVENNRLTSNEIIAVLWPDGNGRSGNVHQSVSRLRSKLDKGTKMTLCNDDCAYQLKKAHSIEKIESSTDKSIG